LKEYKEDNNKAFCMQIVCKQKRLQNIIYVTF